MNTSRSFQPCPLLVRAIVALAIVAFVMPAHHSFAAPIGLERTAVDQEDWIIAIIALAVAVVGTTTLVYKQVIEEHARAKVDVTADGLQKIKEDVARGAGDRFASADESVTGEFGATASGHVDVSNPVDHAPVFNFTGAGRALPGLSSKGILTGKADGTVEVRRVPTTSSSIAVDMAFLTFAFLFDSTFMSLDPAARIGDELSADISYALSSSPVPYEWGFTAEVLSPGVLSIVERRGVFSDTDVSISGLSVTRLSPPAAVFGVPFETDIDILGSAAFAASETGRQIPEPSVVVLLGLAAAARCYHARRRRNGIPRDLT